MVLILPTGELIEFGWGNTHPPGWTGQHGNVSRPWVRINTGPWQRIGSRSMHSAITYAQAAENLTEFLQAAEVQPWPDPSTPAASTAAIDASTSA